MKAWPYDSSWYPQIDNWQLLYTNMSILEDLSEYDDNSEYCKKVLHEADEERDFLSKIFFHKVDIRNALGLELRGTLLEYYSNKIQNRDVEEIFRFSNINSLETGDSMIKVKFRVSHLYFYEDEIFIHTPNLTYFKLLTPKNRVILKEHSKFAQDDLQQYDRLRGSLYLNP